MSKLLWPLLIYFLTVSQWSWCEDQLLLFLSGFPGIFLLLEPDLSSVSPWHSLIYLSIVPRSLLLLQYFTPHLCAVISLMAILL